MQPAQVSAVAARQVTYAYRPSSPALGGVSLEINAGSIVALLGPNGSGKSTLLKLVAQLDRPQGGSITVLGETSADAIRARIGVVFQAPSLDRRMTVRENLLAHSALQGLAGAVAKTRIGELMGVMDLADRLDARVGTLSLGLVRRVDLARALLHEPDVLLLDEPTVGLDPPSRAAFLGAVRAERDLRGASVVMSTHLVDEAEMADRVVLMHRGRIVADGTPGDLRATLGPRVLVVSGDPATLNDDAASAHLGGLTWIRRADGWAAAMADDPACAKAVAALVATGRSFSVGPPTLADLFTKMTGEALAGASAVGDSHAEGRGRLRRDRRSLPGATP